jgi:hypothetical protein
MTLDDLTAPWLERIPFLMLVAGILVLSVGRC